MKRTLLNLLEHAIKLTDSAARKGLIHKNNASRQKARLTKKALQFHMIIKDRPNQWRSFLILLSYSRKWFHKEQF